jgi:type IV pilus assembly protein PilX
MKTSIQVSIGSQRMRGIALPVVLMILLALTGLALFSARYATMSERSSRNQLDMERARQAAESALRDAERDILLTEGDLRPGAACARGATRPFSDDISAFQATCPQGQCEGSETAFSQSNFSGTGTNPEPWWPTDKGGSWNNGTKPRVGSTSTCSTFAGGVPLGTYTGVASIPGVAQQPEYLIELISRAESQNTFFRVTARGFGASEQTQVVLQTYFRPFEFR